MAEQKGNKDIDAKTANSHIWMLVVAIVVLGVVTAGSFLLVGGSALSSCNRILIQQSKYDCIGSLAQSTKNASMCADLPGSYQGGCYYSIATESSNSSVCYDALKANETDGSSCFGYFANSTDNIALCNVVYQPLQGQCIANIAIKEHNSTACGNISNSTAADACATSIGTYYAAVSGNYTYCSTLPGNETPAYANAQAASLSSVGGTSSSTYADLLVAAQNKSTYSKADFCYAFIGIDTENSTYCNYVQNDTIKYICNADSYNLGSNQTVNLTTALAGCSSATGQNYTTCTDSVLIAYAVQGKNTSICGGFQTNLAIECYDGLADTYLNATYCSYISALNTSIAQQAAESCIIGVSNGGNINVNSNS